MNVNQFYSENMAEDITRGLYDNASKCMANGRQPLGYKRGEDGRVVLDEANAAVVREIFTRVAAGDLFVDIARDLNAQGIKTSKGANWNKGSFQSICQNERYRGIYIYGDVRVADGDQLMALMAEAGIIINISLMALNLLPLLPLDGGRIVYSLLPRDLANRYSRIEPYGMYILIALMLFGVLGMLMMPLVRLGYGLIRFIL